MHKHALFTWSQQVTNTAGTFGTACRDNAGNVKNCVSTKPNRQTVGAAPDSMFRWSLTPSP